MTEIAGVGSRQMVGGAPQPTGYDGVPLDAPPPAKIEAKEVDYKKDFKEDPNNPQLKELFASTPELSRIIGGKEVGKNPDGTDNKEEIDDYIGTYNAVVKIADSYAKGKDGERIYEGNKILKDHKLLKDGEKELKPMTAEQVADPEFQKKFKDMMDDKKLGGLKSIKAIGEPSSEVDVNGKKEQQYSANQVNLVLKALQGTVRTEAPPPPPPPPPQQPPVMAQRAAMPYAGGTPQHFSGGQQLPPPTIEIMV